MKSRLFWIVALCTSGIACNEPNARLNAPEHGPSDKTSDLQGTFQYMQDNAALADMNISDMHFVPHRAMLTTLGEQRLSRMVELMNVYGGTIRFSTDLDDAELVRARTQSVVDFLNEAGVQAAASSIKSDLPGGRGMDAQQAVLIKVYEGTYRPKKGGGSSGGTYSGSGDMMGDAAGGSSGNK